MFAKISAGKVLGDKIHQGEEQLPEIAMLDRGPQFRETRGQVRYGKVRAANPLEEIARHVQRFITHFCGT